MRYVPSYCLRVGMKLGKALQSKTGAMLLNQDTVLTGKYIESIQALGISGVYIEDDISKDLAIESVISDELRIETTEQVKNLFIAAGRGQQQQISLDNIKKQVQDIIDELTHNKNMMVNMVDLKSFDNYTYAHSVNVAVLALIVGMAKRLNREELTKLGIGALMHDIGKVFIDKNIINKPDKLTEEEFEKVKSHPKKGYNYVIEKFSLPTASHMAIIDHHEKYDGTGYPSQKTENKISIYGRIIAVADVYDALISERPYRKAMLPSEAIEYIMGNSETHFDPDLVKIFIRKVAPYPVGTIVRLSNEYTGIVIENNEAFCMRPIVRIVKEGNTMVAPYEINLGEDMSRLNIVIDGIVFEY